MSAKNTKPWEETWEHPGGEYPFSIYRGGLKTAHKIADAWESNEQADLIAAAPEMARLLLGSLDELRECVFCDEHGMYRDDLSTWHQPHKPGCRLVAVLRKAGMLSESEEQKK